MGVRLLCREAGGNPQCDTHLSTPTITWLLIPDFRFLFGYRYTTPGFVTGSMISNFLRFSWDWGRLVHHTLRFHPEFFSFFFLEVQLLPQAHQEMRVSAIHGAVWFLYFYTLFLVLSKQTTNSGTDPEAHTLAARNCVLLSASSIFSVPQIWKNVPLSIHQS